MADSRIQAPRHVFKDSISCVQFELSRVTLGVSLIRGHVARVRYSIAVIGGVLAGVKVLRAAGG